MHGAIHALPVTKENTRIENTKIVNNQIFNCDIRNITEEKEKEISALDVVKHQKPQQPIKNVLCFDVLEDKAFTNNHLKIIQAPKIPSKLIVKLPSNTIPIPKNNIILHKTPTINIPLVGKTLDENGRSYIYRWLIHQRQQQSHTHSNIISKTNSMSHTKQQSSTTALCILTEFSKTTVAKSVIADILTNICGPDICSRTPATTSKKCKFCYNSKHKNVMKPWSILCPLIKSDGEVHEQGSLQELLDKEEDMWGDQLDAWISKSFGVKKSATKPKPHSKIILTVR